MIISHSHRFIFVHVSKTGGTSIERALDALRHEPPGGRLNHWRSRLGLHWDHRRHRFAQHDTIVQARRVLPRELFQGYFKFAFVRNPWDWLVSLYGYLQHTPEHRHYPQLSQMSFADYIEFEIQRGRRSQSAFVCDAGGSLLVDFIGRFERLETDFAQVLEQLGLSGIPLPHRNAGVSREPYQSYYDAATRARVAEHWAEDIRRFDYQFEEAPR